MRHVTGWIAACMIGVTAVAVAQPMPQGVPLGADPATGARPGNEIGTGASQPFSNSSSNIGPQDTKSTIAPSLPSPNVGEGASPRRYLEAARTALLVGHTGEAHYQGPSGGAVQSEKMESFVHYSHHRLFPLVRDQPHDRQCNQSKRPHDHARENDQERDHVARARDRGPSRRLYGPGAVPARDGAAVRQHLDLCRPREPGEEGRRRSRGSKRPRRAKGPRVCGRSRCGRAPRGSRSSQRRQTPVSACSP